MTKDEARAAAKRVVEFHEQFVPTFGKTQSQDNAFTCIKTLMIGRCRCGLSRKGPASQSDVENCSSQFFAVPYRHVPGIADDHARHADGGKDERGGFGNGGEAPVLWKQVRGG
jgi:hypothetical protein